MIFKQCKCYIIKFNIWVHVISSFQQYSMIYYKMLSKIVNLSFISSEVPSKFKTSVVFPHIKKIPLYKQDYHPVSNRPYIGKITEKVVVKQMNSYVTVHNLHDLFQSTLRNGHSIETALLHVYNVCCDGKKCVLSLLDLSANFDTINHTVQLQRFEQPRGIIGSTLELLKFYFSGREQFIHVQGASSCKHILITGMPHGSDWSIQIPHLPDTTGEDLQFSWSQLPLVCRQHTDLYYLCPSRWS